MPMHNRHIAVDCRKLLYWNYKDGWQADIGKATPLCDTRRQILRNEGTLRLGEHQEWISPNSGAVIVFYANETRTRAHSLQYTKANFKERCRTDFGMSPEDFEKVAAGNETYAMGWHIKKVVIG